MMTDVDWIKVALTDDLVVAELLLRLNQALPLPPPPLTAKTISPSPSLNVDWTVRQPRSRPVPRQLEASKKKDQPTRASPTTPLSWSGCGATSVSGGGGDGFEECSRLNKPASDGGARSTNGVKHETTLTTTKRPRRKKTLGELKEDEILLLKERTHLKSTLASLRLTVEKQRATNERLKKFKLDINLDQTITMKQSLPEIESSDNAFLLPDLNMPLEDDSCSDILNGAR